MSSKPWFKAFVKILADEWEMIVAAAGFAVSTCVLAAGPKSWVLWVDLALALFLIVRLRQRYRKTLFFEREKHIPLLVDVGPGQITHDDLAMQVQKRTSEAGYDPKLYTRWLDLSLDRWRLLQELALSDDPEQWGGLCTVFHQRLASLSGLPGQRVIFHTYMKCPAALAIGLGAMFDMFRACRVEHWDRAGNRYFTALDLTQPLEQGKEPGHLLRERWHNSEFIHVSGNENLAPQAFVGIHLAGFAISADYWRQAAAAGAMRVHLEKAYPDGRDELTPQDDWLQIIREVYTVVIDLLNQEQVQRVHLALNCPLPIALGLGMALGRHAAVDVHHYNSKTQTYPLVLSLDQLRG